MPRRAVRSALALPFILAATVAAPSPASAAFDADGFAFHAFEDASRVETPAVGALPDGGFVTAASLGTLREETPQRGGPCCRLVRELVVTKLDATGEPVKSWGDEGDVRLPDYDDNVRAVRVLADGTIVVVGGGWDRGWAVWLSPSGALIAERPLRADGNCRHVDAAIGADGTVHAAFYCAPVEEAEAAQGEELPQYWLRTRAYTAAGAEADGITVDWFSASQVAIDSEGRLLVASDGYQVEGDESVYRDVVRVTAAGKRDETYGTGGVAHVKGVYANDTALGVDGDDRAVLSFRANDDGEWWFARLTEAGQPDGSFDTDGVVRVVNGDLGMGAYAVAGQDDGKIVATGYRRGGSGNGDAVLRLNADGSVDRTFDESAAGAADGDGVHVLDGDESEFESGTPVAVPRGTVVPFSNEVRRGEGGFGRAIADAPEGTIVGLLLRAAPKPAVEEPKPEPEEKPQPEEQKPPVVQQQSQTPPPVTVTAQSRTSKTLRSCLSRRSFTIRLRPKALRSATVKVAGKAVKVTRKDGRLTARVDLRKLEQATFDVVVVAKDAQGKTVRETRSYRTCRVGKNGRKVAGGSIITVVQG